MFILESKKLSFAYRSTNKMSHDADERFLFSLHSNSGGCQKPCDIKLLTATLLQPVLDSTGSLTISFLLPPAGSSIIGLIKETLDS